MDTLRDSDQIQLYRKRQQVQAALLQRFGAVHLQHVEDVMPHADQMLLQDVPLGSVVDQLAAKVQSRVGVNFSGTGSASHGQLPSKRHYNKFNGSTENNKWGAIITHQDEIQRMVDEENKRQRYATLRQYKTDLDSLHELERQKKEREQHERRLAPAGMLDLKPNDRYNPAAIRSQAQQIQEYNLQTKQLAEKNQQAAKQRELEEYKRMMRQREVASLEREQNDVALQETLKQQVVQTNFDITKTRSPIRRDLGQSSAEDPLSAPTYDKYWQHKQDMERKGVPITKPGPPGAPPLGNPNHFIDDRSINRQSEEIRLRESQRFASEAETRRRLMLDMITVNERVRKDKAEAKRQEALSERTYGARVQQDVEDYQHQLEEKERARLQQRQSYKIDLERQAAASTRRNLEYMRMTPRERAINDAELQNYKKMNPYVSSKLPGMLNPRATGFGMTSPASLPNLNGKAADVSHGGAPFAQVRAAAGRPF